MHITFGGDRFLERKNELGSLPAGFRLLPIDASVLTSPQNTSLVKDVAYPWGSLDRFLENGCGSCLIKGERMVSWCYVRAFGNKSRPWTSGPRAFTGAKAWAPPSPWP